MKRLFAWLLAVVMLLACFYGCGKAKPQGDEDLSEVFRLNLFYWPNKDKEGVSRRTPTEEELLALGAETVRSRTEKNFSVEIHGEANTQAFYLAVLEKMAIPRKDLYAMITVTVESVREGETFGNYKTEAIYFNDEKSMRDGKLTVMLKKGTKLWEKLYTPEDFPEECGIEGVVMEYHYAWAKTPEIRVYFSPQGEKAFLQTKERLEAMEMIDVVFIDWLYHGNDMD